jgi:hypothetical protein
MSMSQRRQFAPAQGGEDGEQHQGAVALIGGVGQEPRNVIDYMQGVFVNGGFITEYNIHIELVYPDGALIKNCKQVNVLAGTETPVCQWSPDHSENPGEYCSRAWEELSSNNYKMVAKACVGVA